MFKILLNSIRAKLVRYFRSREIIKVMKVAHAQELANTPGEQWPLIHAQHVKEINAVKSGSWDIIDRRTWAYPYIPESLHRLNQPILKNTPYNLRRFSETPIPRRAINLIKNSILSLEWKIEPTPESLEENNNEPTAEQMARIKWATFCMKNPNGSDSYNTFSEAVLEDIIIGGYGTIEPRLTPDFKRPFKMWAVDGTTIRIYADWSESTPEKPHYAQLTGLKGERGIISFRDDELVYIRTNVRSSTPFGLGNLEVAFNSVNAFLGVQDMSARAASDQIHKTFLWWDKALAPDQMRTVRQYVRNEYEGEGQLSLMANVPKPEAIEVTPVTEEDLLLNWQELLIRIIAQAFDLSAMALGLERDVNRNTAEELSDSDFRAAVVPKAILYAEAITRGILWKIMGWRDLQFSFSGLDDPDELTQVEIYSKQYQSNFVVPDEIRKKKNMPPLPGGMGQLTQGMYQILAMAARSMGEIEKAKIGKQQPPGGGGGMQPQLGQGQQNPMQGVPPELQGLDPEELEEYRQAGLIPRPNEQQPEQQDASQSQQQPGMLEEIMEQVQEFLKTSREDEEKNRPKAKRPTSKVVKRQKQLFKARQHEQTREEAQARDIEKRRQYSLTNRPGKRRQGNNYTGRLPGGFG